MSFESTQRDVLEAFSELLAEFAEEGLYFGQTIQFLVSEGDHAQTWGRMGQEPDVMMTAEARRDAFTQRPKIGETIQLRGQNLRISNISSDPYTIRLTLSSPEV